MNDIASIRNMRFLLSGMTLGPLDAVVAPAGLGSGASSAFFADVFRGDNLFSLAVGTGLEVRLVEAEGQIGVDHFSLWFT